MARKAQARTPEPAQDTRDMLRDAAAEMVMATPAFALMQPALDMVLEDLRLGIDADAASWMADVPRRDAMLQRLREDAPGLFGMGHNQPPEPPTPEALRKTLEERFPELVKRRDALLAASERFHSGVPAIADDDTQGKAAEFVKQVNGADKVARAHHKAEKEPWLALGSVVQAFFAGIWEPLGSAKAEIITKMDVYARKKAEESRRLAAEQAAKAKAEAEAAAARAAETMEPEALADAAAAAEAAQAAAAHASAPQADHSRTRGEFGAVSGLTTTWDVAVMDMSLLPDRFKLADMAGLKFALRQAARDPAGVPVWDVPGTDLVRTEATRVR